MSSVYACKLCNPIVSNTVCHPLSSLESTGLYPFRLSTCKTCGRICQPLFQSRRSACLIPMGLESCKRLSWSLQERFAALPLLSTLAKTFLVCEFLPLLSFCKTPRNFKEFCCVGNSVGSRSQGVVSSLVLCEALALCCHLMSSDDEKIRFVSGTSVSSSALWRRAGVPKGLKRLP